MDNTIDTVTISNDALEFPALDFQFLRREGIRHIQKLAGRIWTDHNLHDPGITILDQLCYAITDLSYRVNYDIRDLLAGEKDDGYKSLYSPAQILTVNPVTLLDLRKVVIDIEGVKNAWVEKVTQPEPEIFYDSRSKSLNLADPEGNAERVYISGLFKVLVEKSESTSLETESIFRNVVDRLHASRNLCEDFAEIRVIDVQYITLSGKIEVGQVEDINTFAANVLFRVSNFISPQIRFYSLEELINKNKEVDEIFDGPVLQHGFIDDEELRSNVRRTELHTSDIIREFMDEPEVITVNQIALAIGSEPAQNWRLVLDKEKVARLNIRVSLKNLQFFKNDLNLTVDVVTVEKIFAQLRDANLYFPLEENKRDLKPVPGKYRDMEKYYSIQNHFPQSFGIGDIGLPDSASTKRTAQAKQLKAYLLFFEQILANYFSQVANAKELFSFFNSDTGTYFHQSLLTQVPGVSKIFYNESQYEANLAVCTENEGNALNRKNHFLNHLLARFSESLTDYALWLNDQSMPVRNNAANNITHPVTSKKIIENKLIFLKNYPAISNDRGKAFNYKLKSWQTENISGLEKRIAAKLGISSYKKGSLAGSNEKGFYMLEHILLRPVSADRTAFDQYLVPQSITGFEALPSGDTKCISPAHGLQNGEQIEIRGSEGYDGDYQTQQVVTDSFQIRKAFITGAAKTEKDKEANTPAATWLRTQVDTTILLLTRAIAGFSKSNDKTFCAAPNHGLEENESVEIIGTNKYNGIYKAGNVTKDAFEINVPFVAQELTGRWINPSQRKDPYSLQLTFVFADTTDDVFLKEGSQKDNYPAFIENTIREETPVHLTVYIRWLDKDEMLKFENAYQTFLDQLSNN